MCAAHGFHFTFLCHDPLGKVRLSNSGESRPLSPGHIAHSSSSSSASEQCIMALYKEFFFYYISYLPTWLGT